MFNANVNSTQTTYPLAQYPVGNYFNDLVTQPCRLVNGTQSVCAYYSTPSENRYHGERCSYTNDICDCTLYKGGIQCFAFANKIFDLTHSVGCTSATELESIKLTNRDIAKAYIQGLGVGANVRLELKTSSLSYPKHSVIIADYDLYEITVYEANYGGRCLIGTRTMSYEDFANLHNIEMSWNTSHTHAVLPNIAWTVVGTGAQCRKRSGACILCGGACTEYITRHMYAAGNICYHCGYQNS